MLAAIADLCKTVAPLVSGIAKWFGLRKAKKEGKEEALREVEEENRRAVAGVTERRREIDRAIEKLEKEYKRKKLDGKLKTPKDRLKAGRKKMDLGK